MGADQMLCVRIRILIPKLRVLPLAAPSPYPSPPLRGGEGILWVISAPPRESYFFSIPISAVAAAGAATWAPLMKYTNPSRFFFAAALSSIGRSLGAAPEA